MSVVKVEWLVTGRNGKHCFYFIYSKHCTDVLHAVFFFVMPSLPLCDCVVAQACTHAISNRAIVFPVGFNSICETNNVSITEIPHSLQVA